MTAPEAYRGLYGWEHKVWETAVWLGITGRTLVRRADGSARIVRAEDLRPDDNVLPNELQPVSLAVQDDGQFQVTPAGESAVVRLYHRTDPRENERALREALPFRNYSGNRFQVSG